MADRTVSVRLKADVASYMAKMRAAGKATEEVAEGTSRSFGKASRDIDKIAKRTQFQYKALATAIAAASPVAAATAMGAAATAAGAAFVGLGAVALRNNSEVRNSFIELGRTVSSDLTADAAVLEGAFVQSAQSMGAAYQSLRPQMRQAFADSVPHVETLTDGVIGLARNAMPGLTRAVAEGGGAVQGFATLLADTGTGLSGFFDQVAEHSDAAGQGLDHLGTLMAGTLPSLGGILGNLTELWADHGDVTVDVINRIMSILDQFTGSALPVLGTALGSALGVLDAVLRVIEPMAGVLGPAIAMWLSLAGAMKAIGAVRGVLGGVTSSVGGFVGSLSNAEGRVKAFKVAGAGLAIALGTIAAQSTSLNISADGLRSSLERLADTGEVTGALAGSMGEDLGQLRQAFISASDNGFTGFLARTAEAIPIVGTALQGMDDSVAKSEERMQALDEQLAALASQSPQAARDAFNELTQTMGLSREEIGAFRAELPQFAGAMDAVAQKQRELGTAAMQSRPGIAELEEALTTLGTATASTADHIDALNTAWRELFGVALTVEEAASAFEAGLDEIRTSIEEVQGTSANWRNELLTANGAINLSTEAGRQLSSQLIQQGEDYRALAQATYDTAIKQGQSHQQATATAVAATQQRRRQFIAEMQQMGFNADQARRLADRYFGIPDDVTTLIRNPGMAQALSQARSLYNWYNSIPRHVQTVIQAVAIGPVGMALAGAGVLSSYGAATGGKITASGIERYAGGGRITGPGTGTSDSILAMASGGPIAVSNGEFISTAASTRRNEAALHAANRGAKLVAIGPSGIEGYANGGMVGAAREILKRIQSGQFIFEDLTWRTNDSRVKRLVGQYNDEIADMLKASGTGWYREDIAAELRKFIAKQTKPVEPGRLVKQTPRTAATGAGGTTLVFNFPNYVGTPAELMTSIRREVTTKFGGNVQLAFTGRRS